MWHKTVVMATVGLALASSPGCERAGPPMVRIEGTVRIEEAPVEQVRVVFHPQAGHPRVESQLTAADGRYEVEVPSGKHAVAIVYEINEPMPLGASAQWVQSRSPIPIKYSNPGQSELSVNVEMGGPTKFDFDLSP